MTQTAQILLVEDDPTLGLPFTTCSGWKATRWSSSATVGHAGLAAGASTRCPRHHAPRTRWLFPHRGPAQGRHICPSSSDRTDRVKTGVGPRRTTTLPPFNNEELLSDLALLKAPGRTMSQARGVGSRRPPVRSRVLCAHLTRRRAPTDPKGRRCPAPFMHQAGRTTERDLITRMVWGESGHRRTEHGCVHRPSPENPEGRPHRATRHAARGRIPIGRGNRGLILSRRRARNTSTETGHPTPR